jgi:hypothetical protein
MNLSPSNSSFSDVFTFTSGSSLIDFTALTTLIGSSAAESLILGNHGAAGMAWATMSAFGLAWVIRACISAASPGWLRETMGIRTPVSDKAIGMELFSNSFSRGVAKIRRNHGTKGPSGLVIESSEAQHRVCFQPIVSWCISIDGLISLTKNIPKDGRIESNAGRRFMHLTARCPSC